ncbi:major facilitator superfamily MFS_1 [Segniliparus rotundus DSM 44985]|uniref:Major facilitator superfamily MFS_1 n=1 Tax=Segniliparus rotundus (strain ATCC BAA-972 / CDC 1076 / CIP 108378 / DSM 44985 / JCM 13578) TaxID=640132 RepID=D6ZAC5_SEGRD|nr:MFS transporter [Segniliparus rotundus]ADG96667.1 major facilitator superfamily MFS_1 [Segniliparus rotundus DSM 44985]
MPSPTAEKVQTIEKAQTPSAGGTPFGFGEDEALGARTKMGIAAARASSKAGIPPTLALGFLGLLFFMIGDGVESGFITPFIASHGGGAKAVAAYLITGYGVAVAAASWLAGALSQVFGPKKVMWAGFGIWLVFDVVFLLAAMDHNFPLMALGYCVRGFGYPLFAYGFLVWITAVTPKRRLGTAVGWFYFAFTGGFPTLGSLVASFAIPGFGQGDQERGEFGTLWLAVGILAAGAFLALFGVRDKRGAEPTAGAGGRPFKSLLSSFTVAYHHPKVALGVLVRMINTTPQYALLVLFPSVYTNLLGKGDPIAGSQKWLLLVAVIFGTNVGFNLVFGALSDRIGWRPTIAWFGAVGSAATFSLFYFLTPLVGPDRFWLILVLGGAYGATLGGFVPISALVPQLAPENRGGAIAMLNLGAGASYFVGPGIVSLFLTLLGSGKFATTVIVLTLSATYCVAAPLAFLLRAPDEEEAGA